MPYQSHAGTWYELFFGLATAPPGYGLSAKPLNLMNQELYLGSSSCPRAAERRLGRGEEEQRHDLHGLSVHNGAAVMARTFSRTAEYQLRALMVFR